MPVDVTGGKGKDAGEKGPPSGVRPLLGDVAAEVIDREFLVGLLQEVKGRTKGAWAYCPNCKKKVQCEVSDVTSIVKTVADLIEQVEGRPGTASAAEAGVRLVVERSWPGPSGVTGAGDSDSEQLPPAA